MNAKRDADRLSTTLSIEIQQVSKKDWRVCAPDDQVLGFVEQLAPHRFEILWMSKPLRWGYAVSFTDAISAVSGADESVAEMWPERSESAQNKDVRFESASITPPPLAVRSHHRSTWVTSTG